MNIVEFMIHWKAFFHLPKAISPELQFQNVLVLTAFWHFYIIIYLCWTFCWHTTRIFDFVHPAWQNRYQTCLKSLGLFVCTLQISQTQMLFGNSLGTCSTGTNRNTSQNDSRQSFALMLIALIKQLLNIPSLSFVCRLPASPFSFLTTRGDFSLSRMRMYSFSFSLIDYRWERHNGRCGSEEKSSHQTSGFQEKTAVLVTVM